MFNKISINRIILDIRRVDRVERSRLSLTRPSEVEVVLLAHLLHSDCSRPLHGLQDVDSVVQVLNFGLFRSLDLGLVVVSQSLEGYLPVAVVAVGQRD